MSYARILVVDTETTGLEAADATIEIAGVVLEFSILGWRPTRAATCLVQPPAGVEISPSARATHHIGREELLGAPDLADAWRSVVQETLGGTLVDCALAAHNADFDRRMMRPALLPEEDQDARWLDTCRVARHLLPEAPGYGNQVLRYYAQKTRGLEVAAPDVVTLAGGYRVGADPWAVHRALGDAVVTASLLSMFLEQRTLGELLELQRKPVLLRKLHFGKHAGQSCADVPLSYWNWMLTEHRRSPFGMDEIFTARHYAAVRAGTDASVEEGEQR